MQPLRGMPLQRNRLRAGRTTTVVRSGSRRAKPRRTGVKLLKEVMLPVRKATGKESLVAKGMLPAEESLNAQRAKAAISRRKAANVLPARRVRAATAEEATGLRAKGAKLLHAVNGARDAKGAAVKAAGPRDLTAPAATARHAGRRAPLPTGAAAGLNAL